MAVPLITAVQSSYEGRSMHTSTTTLARFRMLLPLAVALALVAPSAAAGIAREDVLSRGEGWVAKFVPYSQSRFATVAGALVPDGPSESLFGYRTDCSGFVSMTLALERTDGSPLSLDSATLPYRCTEITGTLAEKKAQLKPGDLILRPKSSKAYGHVVVFVRWVDTAKTRYVAYHESSSKGGTVAAEIPVTSTSWFYGESGFKPYRYNKIQDLKLRRSRTWYGPLTTTTP